MLKRETVVSYKLRLLIILAFVFCFFSALEAASPKRDLISIVALLTAALLLVTIDVGLWVFRNVRGLKTPLGNITLVRGWWPRLKANVSAEELSEAHRNAEILHQRLIALDEEASHFVIRAQAKGAMISLIRKQYVELAIGVQTVIERVGKPECNTPARIKRELEAVLERMKTVATFACLSELEGEEPDLPTTMRQNWLTFLAKRAGIRLDEDRARHEKKAKAKESTQN